MSSTYSSNSDRTVHPGGAECREKRITTMEMNAERIYERYVGDYVALSEFVRYGRLSAKRVEAQIEYCASQGWFDDNDVTPDDVRAAIAELVKADLEYRAE
jgi:hypothetical protein